MSVNQPYITVTNGDNSEPLVRVIHLDNEAIPLKDVGRVIHDWSVDFRIEYIGILGSRIDLLTYLRENPLYDPDLVIMDMRMPRVVTDDSTLVEEYFESRGEGKKAVEMIRSELGGHSTGKKKIIYYTQLSEDSEDVRGVVGMGYEVLFKIQFKVASDRLKERITWAANRTYHPNT